MKTAERQSVCAGVSSLLLLLLSIPTLHVCEVMRSGERKRGRRDRVGEEEALRVVSVDFKRFLKGGRVLLC